MRALLVLLLMAAAVAVVAARADSPAPSRESPQQAGERDRPAERAVRRRGIRRAVCPPGTANCAAVVGRVIYVEAVDPDGDGDAHYVLAGGSVTAPGITVVDVKPSLRPRRLPGVGDQVSAAGPVYSGSYGQRQIEATEVHHRRR